MSETWTKEECPQCSAKNWIPVVEYTGDPTNWDNPSYVCWQCNKTIRMFDGEFKDEVRPHIDGESKWDEFSDDGVCVNGLKSPT